ncbi:hypothetical protein JCM3765_003011 [Sporobolomyces pararoseus]
MYQSHAETAAAPPLHPAQVPLHLPKTFSDQVPLPFDSLQDRDQSQAYVSQSLERSPAARSLTSHDLEEVQSTETLDRRTRPMTDGTDAEVLTEGVARRIGIAQNGQRDDKERRRNHSEEVAPNADTAFLNSEMELQRAVEILMKRQVESERMIISAQHRVRRKKKWSLIVTPPTIGNRESCAPSSSTSEFSEFASTSEAVLLPLEGTLTAQAQIIAREFSLPSISGISIFLLLPRSQPAPPIPTTSDPVEPSIPSSSSYNQVGRRVRLTESSWKILWANHLDGSNEVQPISGVNGLPIAGQIQFEVDSKRTRSRCPSTSQSRPTSPSYSRNGGSRLYARPKTPSWTESDRLESQTLPAFGTSLDSASSPSCFHPRPLSIVSHTSTAVGQSSAFDSRFSRQLDTPTLSHPPSPSHSTSQASISNSSTPNEPQFDRSIIALDKNIVAESTPTSYTRIDPAAFPLPPPASTRVRSESENENTLEEEEDSLEIGGSSLDWTYELNRLKEISETSLFRDAATGDSSLDGILVEGLASEKVTDAESPAHTTATRSLPTISPLSLSSETLQPSEKLYTDLVPPRYPFFNIYPATYPHFQLYPSLLSFPSISRPHQLVSKEEEEEEEAITEIQHENSTSSDPFKEGLLVVKDEIVEEAQFSLSREKQNLLPESPTYVDPSVEWYRTATPQDRSPATSSYEEEDESEGLTDSEEEGEELFSHRYDGTMLTTIEEESYTRGFTAQMEEFGSRLEEITEDVPTSDLDMDEEERELDENAAGDDSFSVLEPESPNVPVIVRTRPSVSGPSSSNYSASPHRPAALELQQSLRSPSPLQSPTITPSTVLPLEETPDEGLTPSAESDQFEYELEYGGGDELPYLSTPGLREALGFDDSPELQPFPFPTDESDIDSDDARDFPLETEGTLEADDSCQTFDHLSPLPESPSSKHISTEVTTQNGESSSEANDLAVEGITTS